MKIKIRKSTFETNSSSMHTIVLTKNTTHITKEDFEELLDKDGFFHVENSYDRSFGREFRILDTLEEKLYYLLAFYGVTSLNKLVNAIKQFSSAFKGFKVYTTDESLFDNINDNSSATPYLRLDYYDIQRDITGDIDHQSNSMIDNAIEAIRDSDDINIPDRSDEGIICEILFNTKFSIVIDSDESETFSTLLNSDDWPLKDNFERVLIERWANSDGIDGKWEYKFYSPSDLKDEGETE